MTSTNLRRAFAAAAVALSIGAGTYHALAADVKVGKPAPAFALKDSKGHEVKLADLKGRTVVLEWHNKDCPYVKKHYGSGNMQKLQKDYAAKGVVWLSVISSAEGKQGFVTGPQADSDMSEAKAAPSHVLLDPTGSVGKLYGAKTTPHMFVIDGEGVLRYNGAIDSNSSSNADDIKGAENYTAQALDSLLAGKKVKKATTKPYGCSVKYKA